MVRHQPCRLPPLVFHGRAGLRHRAMLIKDKDPPILQIALTLMGCVKHRKAEPIYALKLNHHAPHALLARHYHERISGGRTGQQRLQPPGT